MHEEQESGSIRPVQVVKGQKKSAVRRRARDLQQQVADAFEEPVALQLRLGRRVRSRWSQGVRPDSRKERCEIWTYFSVHVVVAEIPEMLAQDIHEREIRWHPLDVIRPARQHAPACAPSAACDLG